MKNYKPSKRRAATKCERLRRYADHLGNAIDHLDDEEGEAEAEADFRQNANYLDPLEEAQVQDELFEQENYRDGLENILDDLDLQDLLSDEENEEVPELEDAEIEYVF